MILERTLIVFKPDAVQRGIVGEILARFEKVGLKIVGAKMLQPNDTFFHHHYEGIGKLGSRRGQDTLDKTVKTMTVGPVISFVLEGIETVALVRKMLGATESKSALPGTIRGDYSHISFAHADAEDVSFSNVLHASADLEEAKLEIAHWFSENELYQYETVHEKFTQTKKSHNK